MHFEMKKATPLGDWQIKFASAKGLFHTRESKRQSEIHEYELHWAIY
ncbi:MAG: hypothetical protein JWM99_1451 [Verrucomicrobiales bacterium]|nr:hypothetical protein [Verrucomicrobiales bacterium]